MKKILFNFAIHNHQPIGNFDSVIEDAYERSYLPFIEVLERHPSVKFTQHWTGPLLEWLVRHHPEFVARLRGLVGQGQLEILTGAYYEAILPAIPEQDRLGQIRKLSDAVHRHLGAVPSGLWLAERVWEQPVAGTLSKAGVKFVVVDDSHFRHAGLQERELRGYYMTEEGGAALSVIPIDRTLRYAIPFRSLEETFSHFAEVAAEGGNSFLVHADDGEKFGVWPKTFAHVYQEGWLESFCQRLENEQSWIHTTHLGEALSHLPPQGRIYLPTASYPEMMKWALFPAAFQQLEDLEKRLKEEKDSEAYAHFLRGGFWRNFLAKYPESNHMHKRMLRVSRRVEEAGGKTRIPTKVKEHLWAGECNDPYWHGVFGGLYLPNLRYPIYNNLIQAEADLDRLERLPPIRHETVDFDCDGWPEVIVESDVLNLYFKPSHGGSLVELDYKPKGLNLLDILSRREEGYHKRLREQERHRNEANIHDGVLVKEEGLERYLSYDWYRRASCLDHFFGAEADLDGVAACSYPEEGDFVNQPYEARVKRVGDEVRIVLERHGALWSEGIPHRLSVKKSVRYVGGANRFEVEYVIRSGEDRPRDVHFGVEWNVGLMAGDAHDRYYEIPGVRLEDRRLRSRGVTGTVTRVGLVDEWLGVRTDFTYDTPAELWRFPVETVSLSESGFERLYQSSVLIPRWRFRLEGEHRFRITQTITAL